MRVEGRRDDGAILVSQGRAAAVLKSGQRWYSGLDAALARGEWTDSAHTTASIASQYPGIQSDLRKLDLDIRRTQPEVPKLPPPDDEEAE
jgi:hypothetical protein